MCLCGNDRHSFVYYTISSMKSASLWCLQQNFISRAALGVHFMSISPFHFHKTIVIYTHRNSRVAGLKVEFKKKKLCLKYITIVQYLLFFQVMIKIQFIKTTNIIIQNQRIFLTFLFKPLLCSTLLKFHLIIF